MTTSPRTRFLRRAKFAGWTIEYNRQSGFFRKKGWYVCGPMIADFGPYATKERAFEKLIKVWQPGIDFDKRHDK